MIFAMLMLGFALMNCSGPVMQESTEELNRTALVFASSDNAQKGWYKIKDFFR